MWPSPERVPYKRRDGLAAAEARLRSAARMLLATNSPAQHARRTRRVRKLAAAVLAARWGLLKAWRALLSDQALRAPVPPEVTRRLEILDHQEEELLTTGVDDVLAEFLHEARTGRGHATKAAKTA